MKTWTKILIAIGLWAQVATAAWAQDLTPVVEPTGTPTTSIMVETVQSKPVTLGNQNPMQSEVENAPAVSRPTAVPKFSLPNVVITGENELTIGAKRSLSLENDVNWGAQNLSDINRSTNDLPGLNKSLTALSTQETGHAENTALILNGGGGVPGTYGGWGLFGQDFKDLEFILAGNYSTWGGEATHGSNDGDQKYRWGGEFKLTPTDRVQLRLSFYVNQVDDTLPYQSALQETHQGLNGAADLGLKWSNTWSTQVLFNSKTTTLDYWDQSILSNQDQEFNGIVKLIGQEIDPFWNALTLEIGDYNSSSNLSIANTGENLSWAQIQSRFNFTNNIDLNLFLEGQTGNNSTLNSKLFPAVNFRWRFLKDTQLMVYWKTSRTLDSFYDIFMNREHISPQLGLPIATEITGEWGIQLTQKLDENIVLNLTGSTAQYQNYHQWTDLNALNPDYIEIYSTLSSVQINHFIASLQWKLDPNWETNLTYQWTQGINQSGNNDHLTFLPENQGSLSVTRSDNQLETTLTLMAMSDRQGLDSASLDLPAYATLNLQATYHVTQTFSLWLKGDNLLGVSYMLEPGYLEPQYHLLGGIEVIF